MPFVSELNCYPVKSCAGISLETASFTEQGIAYDREWMVTDQDYTFMSQRKKPEMALITPRLMDDVLRISAPGMETLDIDLADTDHAAVSSTVWGNNAPAILQGAEANTWFSDYLKTDVQFLRNDPQAARQVKPIYRTEGASNNVGFADGASMLLTTTASLQELNTRLEQPVPMNRFRPNVVIDGDDLAPFEEDYWRHIRIGKLGGFVAWACARCIITEINQADAVRGKQVLKALQGFRKGIDAVDPSNKGVFFGQNVLHSFDAGVTVSIGDELTIDERAATRNILGLAA